MYIASLSDILVSLKMFYSKGRPKESGVSASIMASNVLAWIEVEIVNIDTLTASSFFIGTIRRYLSQRDEIWKLNLLKPNDIYMSYRSPNLQTLHFKYLFNKYTYWIF